MGLSTSAANTLLDYMFITRGASTTNEPSKKFLWGPFIWIGLFNGDPASEGVEVSGAGYQRARIGQWNYTSATVEATCHMCAGSTYTDKSTENIDSIMFDVAEENWGTVTHFAIFGSTTDSSDPEDQTMILSGALTASVTINNGYVAMFKKRSGSTAGALKITVS